MAALRGNAGASFLWMLLLWSGGGGCQAQWTGCKSVHYNLVFLLDTSSSVGKEDFEKVQQWVANQVDTFEVGSDCMGVVHSFNLPNVAFILGVLGSREEVKAAAWCIAYHRQHRHRRRAAPHHSPQLLPARRPLPPGLRLQAGGHTAHGWPQPGPGAGRHGGCPPRRHPHLHVDTEEAFKEELEEIASEPKSTHVFHVSDLNAIDKIQGKLRRCLCEDVLCPSVRVEEIALSTPMEEPRKSQEQQKQQTFKG